MPYMALKSALLGANVDKAGMGVVSALNAVFKTGGEESKAATLRSVCRPIKQAVRGEHEMPGMW